MTTEEIPTFNPNADYIPAPTGSGALGGGTAHEIWFAENAPRFQKLFHSAIGGMIEGIGSLNGFNNANAYVQTLQTWSNVPPDEPTEHEEEIICQCMAVIENNHRLDSLLYTSMVVTSALAAEFWGFYQAHKDANSAPTDLPESATTAIHRWENLVSSILPDTYAAFAQQLQAK